MTTCELRCEKGWLPLDREEDHDLLYWSEGQPEYTPMLFPTRDVPCFKCNVEAMNNLVGETNEHRRDRKEN